MKRLGSFLSSLAVVALAAAPPVSAATTSTVMPVSGILQSTDTVSNPCSGEDISFSGNVHVVAGVTEDNAGGFHIDVTINNQDISGVGVTSGAKYQIPTTGHVNLYMGSATTMTMTLNGRVVAQGTTLNFNFKLLARLTIDANSVPTVSFTNMNSFCS